MASGNPTKIHSSLSASKNGDVRQRITYGVEIKVKAALDTTSCAAIGE
ncbi:hypothetical protein CCACVL1_23014 [Corchorus capsularis]|uniref:Uncharacterized protein n=1 Tax=Corchorus capsularis TaxID=210143 RepID=A0A1R3GVI9_COCAP|nr:hypothetical protein CCACVL1_23014 [Corchorus capsularis]